MKKNMLSRIGAVLIIVAMLAMSLTGCGSASTEDQIRATAEGLLKALQAGEFDKLSDYATEEVMSDEGGLAGFEDISDLPGYFIEQLGVDESILSDDAKAAIEDFTNAVLDGYIESYEIGEITVDEDEVGTVPCSITYGFSSDVFSDSGISDKVNDITDAYAQDNYDELMTIYQEEGEDALLSTFYNAVMPEIMSVMKDALAASTGETEDWVMTIENIDGSWKVTALEAAE